MRRFWRCFKRPEAMGIESNRTHQAILRCPCPAECRNTAVFRSNAWTKKLNSKSHWSPQKDYKWKYMLFKKGKIMLFNIILLSCFPPCYIWKTWGRNIWSIALLWPLRSIWIWPGMPRFTRGVTSRSHQFIIYAIYIYMYIYMTYWKSKERRSLFCKLQSNPYVFFSRKILQESRNFSLPLQHVEDIDMRESCTSAFLTLLDRSWT